MATPFTNPLAALLAGQMMQRMDSSPAPSKAKIRRYDAEGRPVVDRGYGAAPPLPERPAFTQRETYKSRGAQPFPVPDESELASSDMEMERSQDSLARLARIGARAQDVDKTSPLWGSGYIMSGATGEGPAQESYSPAFGVTAKIRPGAFAVGAVDPRQRDWAQQMGARQAEERARALQAFNAVQGPINVPDWMKRDPTFEPSVRAARAKAQGAYEQTLPDLPAVTAVNPEEAERRAALTASGQKAMEIAKAEAATSPAGQAEIEQQARARAQAGAAPYAMQVDAGDDARKAFLGWLFPRLQAAQQAGQGATLDDVKMIAAAAGVSPDEVVKMLREQNIQVQ